MQNVLRLECLVLLAMSCSASTVGAGNDAGDAAVFTFGTGGAGGAGGGVGAPPAQGSASIRLDPPSAPGALCGFQHWINVPYDPTRTGPTTTASSSLGKAIDGMNGETVRCSVKQNGAYFDVTGGLSSSGNSATVQISVAIATGQADAPGAISVGDYQTQATFTLDSNRATSKCTFSVNPAAGESLGIAPGRIWAKVTCTDLAVPTQLGTACNVPSSYVVLENCDR